MRDLLTEESFEELLVAGTPILDVRSEKEFLQGNIPFSKNIPILNNQERHLVGLKYKTEGQEKAIHLGTELVNASTKEDRISQWLGFLKNNPDSPIMCFRGGLRSQFAQEWCHQHGVSRSRIQGGYKALRNFLIHYLETHLHSFSITLIGGMTGSGKTALIHQLQTPFSIDLERLAHHRGSAFGGYSTPQPQQAVFENQLYKEILKLHHISDSPHIFMEDESRNIGKCTISKILFEKMRSSPLIQIEEPIENRVQRIYQEYILNSPLSTPQLTNQHLLVEDSLRKSIQSIHTRLGLERTKILLEDFHLATEHFLKTKDLQLHKVWILKALTYYYDPLYQLSLKKRNPKIIFSGNYNEVLSFIKNRLSV